MCGHKVSGYLHRVEEGNKTQLYVLTASLFILILLSKASDEFGPLPPLHYFCGSILVYKKEQALFELHDLWVDLVLRVPVRARGCCRLKCSLGEHGARPARAEQGRMSANKCAFTQTKMIY